MYTLCVFISLCVTFYNIKIDAFCDYWLSIFFLQLSTKQIGILFATRQMATKTYFMRKLAWINKIKNKIAAVNIHMVVVFLE